MFITVFTRPRQLYLYRIRWIQTTPSNHISVTSILIYSIYFLVFREAFSLKAIFQNVVRFSCFPRTLHAPPISPSLIFSLQEYLVFFFLTRIRPQWPAKVSLQRLSGLPRDLLPFGGQVIIFREIRLWSILCRCCFQLFLYWSMCSSTELIFNSRRISVFLFL
jgi:hypothetical protein